MCVCKTDRALARLWGLREAKCGREEEKASLSSRSMGGGGGQTAAFFAREVVHVEKPS